MLSLSACCDAPIYFELWINSDCICSKCKERCDIYECFDSEETLPALDSNECGL